MSSWDSSDRGAPGPEWDLDTGVRRSFGRYELLTKLGSGGMANVYLARAKGPGGFTKLAAVKCIHPHLAEDGSFVEMFLDEARIAAAIDHPNVCSAFDFGEVDGIYYLAMDYLAGESFSEVGAQMGALREMEALPDHGVEPPAPGERLAFVARIVADAAEGLHAAHEAVGTDGRPLGVVHRDVALPNLFLRYDGQVEVVDFGCAKAAGRIFQTEYGKVRGHIAYMAPEILRAEEADRCSDVWSLGVALWELLACERLFRRTSVHDTMFAIVSEEVPPPSTVAPSVPPELDAIAMKALSKARQDRYATAREMADDLMDYVRASGHPMGLAELETWMRRLFPGARERLNRLLEDVAERPAAPAPPPVGPPRAELPTISAKRSPVLEGNEDMTISLTARTPVSSVERRSWSPPWWPFPRVSPRSAAVAAVALITFGLGPLVLGEPGSAHHDANVTDPAELVRPEETTPAAAASAPRSVPMRASAAEADVPRGDFDPDSKVAEETTPHPEPQAAPSAEQADRPRTGRVNVLTPGGWADVMLGSRRLGPTPGQFTLPAGHHRLRLVSGDGQGERWVEVDVRAGAVERVVVSDL